MAAIVRVRCVWSGAAVTGGGLSTFYFANAASGFVADLTTFWNAVKGWLPTVATVTVPNNGDLIDDVTGELAGSWSEGSTTAVGGTGAGQYAQGVGARIVWQTSGVTNGRRVRGSTFIAPVLAGQFEGASGITSGMQSSLDSAADALVTAQSGDFLIWTRPRPGVAGKSNVVTGASVPDAVSWLRSRRT